MHVLVGSQIEGFLSFTVHNFYLLPKDKKEKVEDFQKPGSHLFVTSE